MYTFHRWKGHLPPRHAIKTGLASICSIQAEEMSSLRMKPAQFGAALAFLLVIALVGAAGYFKSRGGALLAPQLPDHDNGYYTTHPILGHAHLPDVTKAVLWEEYPGGRFEMVTNAHGFREDTPTDLAPGNGVRRILVIGDSHTDGVVPNHQSFPNLVEEALNSAGRNVELLNLGTGYYGPDQYRRTLKAWGHLKPDAILVGLYLGNDPLDTLRAREAAGQMAVPRPLDYYGSLNAAQEALGPGLAQGMNQLFLFHHQPDMQRRAIQYTLEAILALASDAAVAQVDLGVVMIPSKLTVEPQTVDRSIQKTLEILDLSRAALANETALADEIRRGLEAHGIKIIDPTPYLKLCPTACYWEADHHLSITGHLAISEALLAHQSVFF